MELSEVVLFGAGVVVTVLVGFLFYQLGRAEAIPRYSIWSLPVVRPIRTEGIEVRYKGTVVPRVTAARIIVWNAGRKTIDGNDVLEEDPVRFEFDSDTKVLSVETVLTSREQINARAVLSSKLPHTVIFRFRFLDRNDGAAIAVLHSGPSHQPTAMGTIKGVPSGLRASPARLGQNDWLSVTAAAVLAIGAMLAAGFWLLRQHWLQFAGWLGGAAFAGLMTWLSWRTQSRRIPRSLVADEPRFPAVFQPRTRDPS